MKDYAHLTLDGKPLCEHTIERRKQEGLVGPSGLTLGCGGRPGDVRRTFETHRGSCEGLDIVLWACPNSRVPKP